MLIRVLLICLLSSFDGTNGAVFEFMKYDLHKISRLRSVIKGNCTPWHIDTNSKAWSICRPQTPCLLENPQFPVKEIKPWNLQVSVTAQLGICARLDLECVKNYLLVVNLVIYYKKDKIKPQAYTWNFQDATGKSSHGSIISKTEYIVPKSPLLIDAMYLRIIPQRFCGSVLKASIKTIMCPSVTRDLVTFPNISANPVAPQIFGKCIENAEKISRKPFANCYNSTGVFAEFKGKCYCKAGYTLKDGRCQACNIREYKLSPGNHACAKCGENSLNNGSVTCQCLPNHYRRIDSIEPGEKCFPEQFFGKCPRETIVRNAGEYYEFSVTRVNHRVIIQCKHGLTDQAKKLKRNPFLTRSCFISHDNKARWEDFDLTVCKEQPPVSIDSLNKVTISNETAISVARALTNITSNSSTMTTGSDIGHVTQIMEKCIEANGRSTEVTGSVLESINNILRVNKTIIGEVEQSTGERVLNVLEKVAKMNADRPLSFSSRNLGFAISQTDAETDLYATVNIPTLYKTSNNQEDYVTQSKQYNNKHDQNDNEGNTQETENLKITFSKTNLGGLSTLKNNPASVYIPKSVFKKSGSNESSVFAYTFKKDSLYITSHNDSAKIGNQKSTLPSKAQRVGSYILSMSLHNATVQGLKQPIEMVFQINQDVNPDKAKCSYWEQNGEQRNFWSTSGCHRSGIVRNGNDTFVKCQCDHLTNFAVLFNVHNESDDELDSDSILSLVSLVGCSISIACLVATLISYLALREIRKRTLRKIIINFCFSLLFLLTTFIFGVDVTKPDWTCHLSATLIHYFTLSTFFWMAFQTVFLYKKSVRATKNRGDSELTYKVSLAVSWGVPFVITGITFPFTIRQFNDGTKISFCVISGTAFIWGTLIPAFFILLLNLSLFIPIMRKVHRHLTIRSSYTNTMGNLWRRCKVTLSCTALFGLTWLFGFFAVSDVRTQFQWLFCISNSLQGFFIFIFHVVLNKKVTQEWRRIVRSNSGKDGTSSSMDNSSKSQNNCKPAAELRRFTKRNGSTS